MMKGCGLIVAKTRDGEVRCGEEMWGKRRYCAYCSKNLNKEKSDEN